MNIATTRGAAKSSLSLPNILTYARIAAIPVVVGCIYAQAIMDGPLWLRWVALAVFIAAGVTDFLDGYYARIWDQHSAFGRMLDPIADKLLVASCLLILAADGIITTSELLPIPLAAELRKRKDFSRVALYWPDFRHILTAGERSFAPLSNRRQERLLLLHNYQNDNGDFDLFSYDLYLHLKQAAPEFEQLAAVEAGGNGFSVRQGAAPARPMRSEYVSGNYFSTLGVGPYAGRLLNENDDTPGAHQHLC